MFVELRVHGVSGTPPVDVLDHPLVKQVAGDEDGRFFRPVDAAGREIRAAGVVAGAPQVLGAPARRRDRRGRHRADRRRGGRGGRGHGLSDCRDLPGLDLVTVGTVALLLLGGFLGYPGRRAVGDSALRRGACVIWDVVAFWPPPR